MPTEPHIFSLLDVCNSIRKTLAARYGSTFWVKAELHRLNFYPGSGHCFPELLQKENGTVVAQMRATLWNSDFRRIDARFREILHEPLKDGIEIIFSASIQYDPQHGLSLRIHDIDPNYVLGSLERERALCLQRLREEGLFERNRQMPLSLLPAKIAVISASTSKGFSDFMQILQENGHGYSFFVQLFPALLQGDGAVASIREALQKIQQFPIAFDMAMIIRGGGDEVGLSVYNNYELAHEICLYPLPVLTGIGHSTNLTVCEQVAWFNGITPTELAVFVLRRFEEFETALLAAEERLQTAVNERVKHEKRLLENIRSLLRGPQIRLQYQRENLKNMQNRIRQCALKLLKDKRVELQLMGKTLHRAEPERNLKMGYSLTYQNNKLVFNATDIEPEQELVTHLAEGVVVSMPKKSKNKQKNG